MHTYSESFPTSKASTETKRSCTPTEEDEVCFYTSLKEILLLVECLQLEAFPNVAELVSISFLEFALKQMSTMQCVSKKTDDRVGSQSEYLSLLPRLETLIDRSDRRM